MTEDNFEESPRRKKGLVNTISNFLTVGFGKLPPQAVDLEEMVLGALMLESRCLDDAIAMLHEDFFYKDTHRIIYKSIKSLYINRTPVDIGTITHELRRTEELDIIGGAFYITQLTNRVASTANIQYHILIIKQMWGKRELIRIASEIMKDGYDDSSDVFELQNKADSDIQKMKELLIGGMDSKDWISQVNETVKELTELYKAPIKVTGVTTGSVKLNKFTGGWQRTDLIIVAARPGMGKTSRVINFIKQACWDGKSVILFSLEMGRRQITKKFLSEHSNVFGDKLISGNISNLELDKIRISGEQLSKMKFLLNDKGAVNPNYIRSVCRSRKKKEGLDLVIIDYLQLMTPNERAKGQNREQEISGISAALKALAKELDVPVIALSQLNRGVEQRSDKRPQLSDLRESGAIEQDADMVIGLYRPSYYNDFESREREYSNVEEGDYERISELLVLKNRNGAPNIKIAERFWGELSRFTTIEDEVRQEYIPPNKLVGEREVPERPF